MKPVILLSITFSFLSFSINNKGFAAGKSEPKANAPISPKDPKLSVEKYCISKCAPVIKASPTFDAKADAEAIRKAMKGIGARSKVINPILIGRSNAQRLEIIEAFKTAYKNRDLVKELRSELTGNYETVVAGLMTPLPVYIAKELHDNIAAKGSDRKMMVENLCSYSNFGIKSIAEVYKSLYSTSLEDDVKRETSGSFQYVMISAVQGKREENQKADNAKAVADAQSLHKTKGPQWLADTSQFNTIFTTRSYEQLRLILGEYKKIASHEIDEDIPKEFKGDVGLGLLEFVKCARSKDNYIAERLHDSLENRPIKHSTLIRILVSRNEIDMRDISNAYNVAYKKNTLMGTVLFKTRESYEEILLGLVRGF